MDTEVKGLLEGLHTANEGIKTLITQMQSEVKVLGSASEETKTNIDKLLTSEQKLRDDLNGLTLKFESSNGGNRQRAKTLGETFTEHAQFKSTVAAGHKYTGKISVGEFFSIKQVTGNPGDGQTAGIPLPGRIDVSTDPKLELRIRDLLNVIPTSQNSVEFVRYTFTNNAAIVFSPMTGSQSPGMRENVVKPQSDMAFTRDTETAETIAHWIPASEQILQDIPQLRQIIDTEMRYGVKLAEEEELLNGDGTAGHLNGLMNQAAAFDTGLVGVGDTALDRLRAGILQARIARYPVDGFVLNPIDWFEIETLKDEQGRYIIGDPTGMIQRRLWGKPVVESDSMAAGSWLTGAFGMAARLYDLQQNTVETTNSHDDFFIRNMIAIRAEERIIFVVLRPQAFVQGTFA